MSKVQKAIDALDGCDEYSLRHHLSEVSILIEGYAEAQAGLAALREELATLQSKHDRTELALSGSMKALTRVDNMWKKRWLEKTSEPSIALVVDDEFKSMFEEIKGYRKRLTAAEHRNAELVELLREVHKDYRHDISGPLWNRINSALKPTESGASE